MRMFRNLPKLLDRVPTHGPDNRGGSSDADQQRKLIVSRLHERKRLQSFGTPENMFIALRGGAVIQGKLLRFDESSGEVALWETTRHCKMHLHVSDIAAIS